jgi:hypothetical protein
MTKKSSNTPNSSQAVDWSGSFWCALIQYLRSVEMPDSLIGHAPLTVLGLASAALGYPIFLELKSRILGKISKFLHQCSELVPKSWIFDTSRTAIKIRDVEVLRGKMIISWNKGLPVKELDLIYNAYVNSDPPTGYIGLLPKTDPRRGSPDVLTVDLDEDRSSLVRLVAGQGFESKRLWKPEIQEAFLKTAIRGMEGFNESFDSRFLKKHWSSVESPLKVVSLRVYSLVAAFSQSICFDEKGTPTDPLRCNNETSAMTYELVHMILSGSLNRRLPTADCSYAEVKILNVLKRLQATNIGNACFNERTIEEFSELARSTVYRHLTNLAEKCLIKLSYTDNFTRHYSLNPSAFEEFENFRLPTWEDYKKETPEISEAEIDLPSLEKPKKGPGRPPKRQEEVGQKVQSEIPNGKKRGRPKGSKNLKPKPNSESIKDVSHDEERTVPSELNTQELTEDTQELGYGAAE